MHDHDEHEQAARQHEGDGRDLTALVRAGAMFIDGKLQEESTDEAEPTAEEAAA